MEHFEWPSGQPRLMLPLSLTIEPTTAVASCQRRGNSAKVGEGSQIEPDWDLAAQPAPDYEVDQRVNW